jgi:hypothetical protein
LIFRNEILEEKDLLAFSWPILIDDEKIKETRHYLHVLKRICLSIIIKLCTEVVSTNLAAYPDDETSFFKSLIDKIRASSIARLVQISFDTVHATLGAVNVDVQKLTAGRASVDVSRLLKRQNDLLLEKRVDC